MSSRGLILGIESSCDETAASVVERGARTLSSVVASQIPTHARYGGVVPELASREHLRAIVPVVRGALEQAGITLADLDAIAVTSGPGLAGALLVGITYAKALAFAQNLPLIAINHLEGHIHAVLLQERENIMQGRKVSPASNDCEVSPPRGNDIARMRRPETADPSTPLRCAQDDRARENAGVPGLAIETWDSKAPDPEPALALVVSGGHTHLFLARPAHGSWNYSLVGRTLDDAAGEAYDKVAKLLGFGYPGGPWIDALARHGNPLAVPFAFSQIKHKVHLGNKAPRTKAARTAPIADLDPRFLFSFSGIKTAVLRYVELHNLRPGAVDRAARLFPRQAPSTSHFDSNNVCHPERAQRVEGPAFDPFVDPQLPAPAKPPQTRAEALALAPQPVLDLVASFQHAVVGDLMKKTFAAAESLGAKRILVTGGVAANRELRTRFAAEAAHRGMRVAFPTPALSTDNAAMVAAAAWPRFLAGEFAPPSLSADPSLALGH